jgi:hypothetical protein
MLDQLFNIVKNFGQRSVVNNPEVPKEHSQAIMADATGTIASGFQNVLAGGGFGNLLNLFKRKNTSGGRGLLQNPIVSMMIGYFISKLVGKYRMTPTAASNVAHDLIPNSVGKLVDQTNDPNDRETTLDRLIKTLTGEKHANTNAEPLQDMLDNSEEQPTPEHSSKLSDVISNLARKTQETFTGQAKGTSGWSGLLKQLIPN